MNTTVELSGKNIFRIKHIKSGLPYGQDTKNAGETYSRFRYNGTVFIVPDSDNFVNDFLKGKVHTIWLTEGTRMVQDAEGNDTPVASIQFDSHINNDQIIGMTKTEAILNSITKGNFKAEIELTEDALKELEEA